MLVLSRKVGEKLVIDGGITVVVSRVAGNRVTLGIEAPDHVRILRSEIEPLRNAFAGERDARLKVPVVAGFSDEPDVANASVPRLAK